MQASVADLSACSRARSSALAPDGTFCVTQLSCSVILATARYDVWCPDYNRHFRQFMHVSFKIAAQLGSTYLDALAANEAIISQNVTGNLFFRHLQPIFGS